MRVPLQIAPLKVLEVVTDATQAAAFSIVFFLISIAKTYLHSLHTFASFFLSFNTII